MRTSAQIIREMATPPEPPRPACRMGRRRRHQFRVSPDALTHVVQTNDNMLLTRVIRGHDRKALELLHQRQFRRVRAYVARRLGSRAPIDDIVQDVFISLFTGTGDYDGRRDAGNYLLGVAHNVIRRYLRDEQRRLRPSTGNLSDRPPDACEAAREQDPIQGACDREALEVIKAMMMGLSPKAREAIRLRFIEELDSRQAAAKAGCSAGAFNKRLHKAIRKLQSSWKDISIPRNTGRSAP